MQFWLIQGLNSLTFGGLLFLVSVGFSLIFGLMRVANMSHGVFFMLGAYIGANLIRDTGVNLALAALLAGAGVAAVGYFMERFVLRRLVGNLLGQVLATLGIAFIIADGCLMIWGGSPVSVPTPESLRQPTIVAGFTFPTYRLVVVGVALVVALGLYVLLERSRIGAMIRAGVDDWDMARAVGIPVSRLSTLVFCLGAAIAGAGGVIGGPILSAYPGLDMDMLLLALIVVILGGMGSLLGSFVSSFLIAFIYTFGTALLPDVAYVILFLPMIVVLVFRPRGLFGRLAV
jgi:branched-chain amino acid transport system permease protein